MSVSGPWLLSRIGQRSVGGNLLQGTAKAVFRIGVYGGVLTVLLDVLPPP